MPTPSYTTDLQTINLAQDTGTWDELDDWAGGGTIYTDETDYYIQGGNCSSQLATKTGAQDETSLVVDYGSDLSSSFTAGITCVFMWHVFLPANALDTFDNGGLRLAVGADLTEFDAWKVGGKDFGRNPYGGWQNVAVDPSNTPDYQDDGAVGNGGVYRWFGSGVYLLSAISKGAPHGVDAIRYGRGELEVTEGEADVVVLDSYSESNWSNTEQISGFYGSKGKGQSFTTGSNPGVFVKSSFYVSKTGSPTGTIYSRLYLADDTNEPDGAAVATSARDATTLTAGITVQDFDFTDGYQFLANTEYVITIEYDVDGGSANRFDVGNDTSSPTHAGVYNNLSTALGTWNTNSSWDIIFYVYEADAVSGDFAIFSGIATANDISTARWGLFQEEGTGYLWKGLMSLGISATAVDFRDSNVNITIDDTPGTYVSFNRIEINHASSNVKWTGIAITAVNASGLSIGQFEVIDDAKIGFDTCTFTDMSTFVFHATSTIATVDNCTFRRCGQITQGLTSFDGCIFEESPATVSLLASDIDKIDNCDFYSDGLNHAIELTSAHAGNSYTLIGCSFTGYASSDGTTGNECIYNNSGGAVTISVGTGQLPTIRNEPGSSTTVSASVPLYIIVKDEGGNPIQDVWVGIYKTSDRTEIKNQETDIDGEVDTGYTQSTPEEVEVRCRKASSSDDPRYKNYSSIQTIATTTGLALSVTMQEDPNNNATT
jgi:hypothetical protein